MVIVALSLGSIVESVLWMAVSLVLQLVKLKRIRMGCKYISPILLRAEYVGFQVLDMDSNAARLLASSQNDS